MTIASTRFRAALLPPLLLCCAQQGAWGADRRDTVASVTIVRPVAVTVVNNTPLQAALLTTALVPVGVVFTASNAGPVTIGVSGGASSRVSGGASSEGAASTTSDAGLAGGAGAGPPGTDAGLVAVSGSLNGTTINGDAVSVSVGDVSGGTAPGSGRVPMIIAQYN